MNTQAKHTPGPWFQDLNMPYVVRNGSSDVDGGRIASCASYGNAKDVIPNARLIAAAPELLEALQEIAAHHPLGSMTRLLASTAIHKATGA